MDILASRRESLWRTLAPDQDGSRFARRDAWAETGLVYAVDINPEATRYIEDRAQKEQLQNVKTILGKADDPLLPAGSVDAVLLLKTYHEIAQPVDFAAELARGSASGSEGRNH